MIADRINALEELLKVIPDPDNILGVDYVGWCLTWDEFKEDLADSYYNFSTGGKNKLLGQIQIHLKGGFYRYNDHLDYWLRQEGRWESSDFGWEFIQLCECYCIHRHYKVYIEGRFKRNGMD